MWNDGVHLHNFSMMGSALPEVAEHLLAPGKWRIDSFGCSFSFPIKLSLPQPMSSLAFTLPIPSPVPLVGGETGF